MVDVRIEGSEALVRLPGAQQSFVFPVPEGISAEDYTRLLQNPASLAAALPADDPDVRVAMAKNTPLGEALRQRAAVPKPGERQTDYDVRMGGKLTGEVSPGLATDIPYAAKLAVPFAQGATAGFSDEMIAKALAMAKGGTPEEQEAAYEYYRTKGRATLDAVRADEPLMAVVAEMAGTLLPTGLLAKGAKAVASMDDAPAFVKDLSTSTSKAGNLAKGAALGAVEGGAYALGTSEEGLPYPADAVRDVGIGAVAGGAGVVAAGAVSRLAKWFAGLGNEGMKRLGIDLPTLELIKRASGDDPAAIQELGRVIATRGPEAMPVDVMPGGADLIDAIIQSGGKGGQEAAQAIGERSSRAAANLGQEMDTAFGGLGSTSDTAMEANLKSRPASAAYERAYARPVDYSTDRGQKIADILEDRVPQSVMDEARRLYTMEFGTKGPGQQFFVREGTNGGPPMFERTANMQELDVIIRALNDAAEGTRAPSIIGNGRMSNTGRVQAKLAKELRQLARLENPDYDAALNLFSNLSSLKDARDLGREVFSDRFWAADVVPSLEKLGGEQKRYVRKGMREFIENEQSKLKAAISGLEDQDYREAVKAFKLLSSSSNRQKAAAVLGDEAATRLFRALDEDALALQLKSLTKAGSRTAVRSFIQDLTKDLASRGLLRGMRSEGPVRGVTNRLLDALVDDRPADEVERIMRQAARVLVRQGDAPRVFDYLASAVDKVGKAGDRGDAVFEALKTPSVGAAVGGSREGSREGR
jgi:hypothetical protein